MQFPSIDKKGNHPDELIFSNHFNLHTLCAIEIITNGPDPKYHDIEEICIFPLNSRYQISRTIIPFNTTMKPRQHWLMMDSEYVKKHKINKKRNEELWDTGIERSILHDLFESWFENKIKPAQYKKIMPLTYDWATKKAFLIDWLGKLNFESFFHWHARDIMSLALFCNDFSDIHSEEYKIAKVDFNYICSSLRIETHRTDTITRCHSIAKVYETILHSFYSQMFL